MYIPYIHKGNQLTNSVSWLKARCW